MVEKGEQDFCFLNWGKNWENICYWNGDRNVLCLNKVEIGEMWLA